MGCTSSAQPLPETSSPQAANRKLLKNNLKQHSLLLGDELLSPATQGARKQKNQWWDQHRPPWLLNREQITLYLDDVASMDATVRRIWKGDLENFKYESQDNINTSSATPLTFFFHTFFAHLAILAPTYRDEGCCVQKSEFLKTMLRGPVAVLKDMSEREYPEAVSKFVRSWKEAGIYFQTAVASCKAVVSTLAMTLGKGFRSDPWHRLHSLILHEAVQQLPFAGGAVEKLSPYDAGLIAGKSMELTDLHRWSVKEHGIGIAEFDLAHQWFFEMARGLGAELRAPHIELNHIFILLASLESYATLHFSSEEFVFATLQYPKAREHAKEHRAFLSKIANDREQVFAFLLQHFPDKISTHVRHEFVMGMDVGSETNIKTWSQCLDYVKDVYEYLVAWVNEHIAGADKEFHEFLKEMNHSEHSEYHVSSISRPSITAKSKSRKRFSSDACMLQDF